MIKHVLGISGGKDSAALAIYLKNKFPSLNMTYYFCDTGKELDETYEVINNLEIYLGKPITKLVSSEAAEADQNPFDFYYKAYRGYLPSSLARWCTKKMKLEPFENFVGDQPVVSYVGIRGDEDREGYISTKSNIQSIFPFRKNIWSEDVINKVLDNSNISIMSELLSNTLSGPSLDNIIKVVSQELKFLKQDKLFNKKITKDKLEKILNVNTIAFNKAVFQYLKNTDYPLAKEEDFPLLEKEDVLVRSDIFKLLEDSGVGVPNYYKKISYEIEGKIGEYARSRSGCYFCFFQQKIEWIWLYEQHPELFEKAMIYENEDAGFTWNQHESLKDLIHPIRMNQIKKEHQARANKTKSKDSSFLLDILDDTEASGCNACFI